MFKILTQAISDGQGSISSMRLTLLLGAVAIIGSKIYNSILTKQPITWDTQDSEMLGVLLTGKVIQNAQENNSDQTPPVK